MRTLLFLVNQAHKYGEGVPVQIDTQVIDHLVVTMNRENCNRLKIPGTGTPEHCNFKQGILGRA